MPEINHVVFDQTLHEIDKLLDQKMSGNPKRSYLGMSGIGHECIRKSWYDYRLTSPININASGCRAIEDGFDQEDEMAKRLRMLPFIELYTKDPNTGKQIAFSFLDGHFRGHADGMIKGIKESPNKWHVWEHKSVNIEKFNKLKKLREEKGEKKALIECDYIYWTQAQCYMHASGLDRHYLTVSAPGGRDYISIRTDRSESAIDEILEKANTAIKGKLPDRISKNREFYLCKMCNHFDVCWDEVVPLKNCGTCDHRLVWKDGKFACFLAQNETLKDMEPCKDYQLLIDFGTRQRVASEFNGEIVKEKGAEEVNNVFQNVAVKWWDS